MALRWKLDDDVVTDSVFKPGKLLTLEGFGISPPPQYFEVFRVHSRSIGQILRFMSMPPRETPSGKFNAVWQPAKGVFISDSKWRLAEPRGRRRSAEFVFRADSTPDAPSIFSSFRAKAKITGQLGGSAGFLAGPIPVGLDGKIGLDVELRTSADPVFDVSVVSGDDLVEQILADLITEFQDMEGDEYAAEVLRRFQHDEAYIREVMHYEYRAPESWSVSVDPVSLELGDNDSGQVHVSIEIAEPGRGYFALMFDDQDAPVDSAEGETTDVWAIDVDREGQTYVISDVSTLSFPDSDVM